MAKTLRISIPKKRLQQVTLNGRNFLLYNALCGFVFAGPMVGGGGAS
jgi:hypothetical protein